MTVYRCSKCGITTDTGLCRDFDTPDGYPELGPHQMVEWIEEGVLLSLEDVIALNHQSADDLWQNDEDDAAT